MGIINGAENKNHLICCNICGGFCLDFEFIPRKNDNTIFCYDCGTKSHSISLTKDMLKYHSPGVIYQTEKSILYESEFSKSFYEQKSEEQFGCKDKWYELFISEEVSKLSTYSQEKGKNTLKEFYECEKRKAERAANPLPPYSPPKPHCPTCNSTNVQKISDLRKAGGALMFGLLSTTARSQFECKNCGYKW